ncbi:MAG: alpha-mannosidase [Erysipelothrix sp.]|nr:alpha-mannosidase [Erysipelothrix sp.]
MNILDFIDTRHGSDNRFLYSNGNTLPFTGSPFGMNYFVVQTDVSQGSFFFNPNHKSFSGYRLTHQPSPWMGDFSHFALMPVTNVDRYDEEVFFQSSYRPEDSTFNPHVMKHYLQRYQIDSTLSAKTYSAMSENITRNGESVNYVLKADKLAFHNTTDNTLNFSVANFSDSHDKDFTMYVTMTFNHKIEITQKDNTIFIKGNSSHSILILATSFISYEQAELNLKREHEDDMEDYTHSIKKAWSSYMNRIEVKDKDFDKVKLFYQNMYRAFLFPMKFYEVNEDLEKIHYDTYSKSVKHGVMYTNNGFWDTSKTVYPLYSLIAKEEYAEILEGFLNSYHNSGYLPKWLSPDERGLMPGTLIDAVIADAATKNIAPHLMESYFDAMLDTANKDAEDPKFGRRAASLYRELGYVPNDFSENVNQSLDNTYSDFCIAKVAKSLGKDKDYNTFMDYAKNYKNLFNKDVEFMVGKDRDGNWSKDFSPLKWGGDYTEGSVWQNGFAIFHDVEGFKKLFKDKNGLHDKLVESANTLPNFDVNTYGFEIHEMSEVASIDFGQIGISNQPSFHIPYMFNFTNNPENGELLLKNIMSELFTLGYEGYPGDEDNGSMASWYIFSSMGFYPFCSGTKQYTLGISMYDSIKINTSYDAVISINTKNNHKHFNFVKGVSVNDQVIKRNYLNHDELIKGANITFELSLLPEDKSGHEKPYSITK